MVMEKNQAILLLQDLSKELSCLNYDYLDLAFLNHLRHEVNTKLEKLVLGEENKI